MSEKSGYWRSVTWPASTKATAPGEHEAVAEREIGAALDQVANIIMDAAPQRGLRIDPGEQPETLGRIEQAVRMVVAELADQPADEIGVAQRDAGMAVAILV